MQDKWVEIRDTYLKIGEKQMDKYSVVRQTPTVVAPTSRLTLLGLWRIVGVARSRERMWKLKREGNRRNNEGMGWNEGLVSLNGLILKRTPAGSGRVWLNNHTTISWWRFVSIVTAHRWFRRVCPSLKITERCSWYDGGIQRSVAGATVRRCIHQGLLHNSFLQNFLVMCL